MKPSPKRIQRKRSRGWKMPPNTVTVDRKSLFGNPFPVTRGTQTCMGVKSDVYTVGTWNCPAMWIKDTKQEASRIVVDAFRAWLLHPSQAQLLAKAKLTLRGKNLACWCPLTDKDGNPVPCHADILLEIANA